MSRTLLTAADQALRRYVAVEDAMLELDDRIGRQAYNPDPDDPDHPFGWTGVVLAR